MKPLYTHIIIRIFHDFYMLYLIIPPQIFMKYIPKPEYHADLFSMIIKVSTDSMLKHFCTLHFSELLKKKKRKKITYHIYQLQRLRKTIASLSDTGLISTIYVWKVLVNQYIKRSIP